MDRKAIHATVRDHLLAQGRRSETPFGQCRYRAPDGLRCAIGALIPDELYDPHLERAAITPLVLGDYDDPLRLRLGLAIRDHLGVETEEDADFLGRLQDVHDRAEPADWAAALDRLCPA